MTWEVSNILENDDDDDYGLIVFDLILSKGEGSNRVSMQRKYIVDKFKTTKQDQDDVNFVF